MLREIATLLYGITHQDTVDPEEACQGPYITQYQISFETGSTVNTDNVSLARCTAGRCNHTFEPPSNPPSSYDSLSVAAVNVVGVELQENVQHNPLVSC